MYLMYADESGSTGKDYTNIQQPIFVLGGFIINDKDWHKVNKIFDNKKIELNSIFKTQEIHTNEIFNSSKKSIFDKFDWRDNLRTLESLADIICELDITFFHIVIDKNKYKESLEKQKNEKNELFSQLDPYHIAFIHLYKKFSSYMYTEENENGLIFLDEFTNVIEDIPILSNMLNKHVHENIIENALFLKSNSSNFIQIADFYSFYMNKYYSITLSYKTYSPEKQKHCLDIAQKLLNKTNKDYCVFLDKA